LVRRSRTLALLAVLALPGVGCVSVSEPEEPPRLEFSRTSLDLGAERDGQLEIRNAGGQSIGPVEIVVGAIQDANGATIPGSRFIVSPGEIPTLNPGDMRVIDVELLLDGSLPPGSYDAALTATAGLESAAQAGVSFVVDDAATDAASLTLSAAASSARMGDVVPVEIDARDPSGTLLQGVTVRWAVSPTDAGYIATSGLFVGYRTGTATLVGQVGSLADTIQIDVVERGVSGSFEIIGRARETLRHTSDLWLHEDVVYAGTWGSRTTGGEFRVGNTLNVWNAATPSSPERVFSMEIDARTVNDVKIRADGALAVITHEGSADGQNGITLLGLDDPEAPEVLSRFTSELESGVHNAWIEGDFVYLVVDGVGNGLRILDISDPANPAVVGRFWAGSSFLHDVYVRDGLAFLSHWNAGLVILDVGNGVAGGSPGAPVEVARLPELGGETHNAWYWPEAGYVFVGEEDFSSPGIMHVVDIRNVRAPREVATYAVPGQTPHNFWIDESTGTAYFAWYGNGVRALDVTGDLIGELDRQDREIAGFRYNGGAGSCNRGSSDTCSWAPQLHRGSLWVSDMNEGLIALSPPR